MMKDIDLMLFDLQDLGVRYYTYLCTLHYVMEACAGKNIPSFVGMHPVPIVYGMTLGQYARMILGENWLDIKGKTLDFVIVPLKNHTHKTKTVLPIPPSPNLPNAKAIKLYQSLFLFDRTHVSVGRGTPWPF